VGGTKMRLKVSARRYWFYKKTLKELLTIRQAVWENGFWLDGIEPFTGLPGEEDQKNAGRTKK